MIRPVPSAQSVRQIQLSAMRYLFPEDMPIQSLDNPAYPVWGNSYPPAIDFVSYSILSGVCMSLFIISLKDSPGRTGWRNKNVLHLIPNS